MRYLLIAAALFGCFRLVADHYDVHQFHDMLAFAKKHPSGVSPAIDYYTGLVYYQRSDYPEAQEAFGQLLQDYPTGQYEASGLVRLEDSAEYNKDWDTAKTAAQRYTEDFPNGSEIQVIQSRIQDLTFKHSDSQ